MLVFLLEQGIVSRIVYGGLMANGKKEAGIEAFGNNKTTAQNKKQSQKIKVVPELTGKPDRVRFVEGTSGKKYVT